MGPAGVPACRSGPFTALPFIPGVAVGGSGASGDGPACARLRSAPPPLERPSLNTASGGCSAASRRRHRRGLRDAAGPPSAPARDRWPLRPGPVPQGSARRFLNRGAGPPPRRSAEPPPPSPLLPVPSSPAPGPAAPPAVVGILKARRAQIPAWDTPAATLGANRGPAPPKGGSAAFATYNSTSWTAAKGFLAVAEASVVCIQ